MSQSTTRKPHKALMLALAALLPVSGWSSSKASDELKGYEIAARSDRSDRGFSDSEVRLEMILRNKAGKESARKLLIRTFEVPDEQIGDKSLILFHSPRDIKGTALLSHAKIVEPDDQWLYLPAMKRVKRISSVNKSGPFVGSEFAFEDLTAREVNKYDYKYLRSEPCGSVTCDVVEGYPRYKNSGYTKQVAWIDQEVFQVRKLGFYDRKGELLKTLTLDNYKHYGGKYWRPLRMRMVNHQTGKSTDLIFTDYTFQNGFTKTDFVKTVLSRGR